MLMLLPPKQYLHFHVREETVKSADTFNNARLTPCVMFSVSTALWPHRELFKKKFIGVTTVNNII